MNSTSKLRLLAVGSFLLLAAALHAAPRTWDGGGKDGSFVNPLNWDGDASIPTSNSDSLQVGPNTVGAPPSISFDNSVGTGGEFRASSFTFQNNATVSYTVTALSNSDSLTLTNTGTALQNASPVHQNFTLITTTVGAATQTWDGGAQGLTMSSIDLGSNHTLTIDGTGTTAATRNEISGGLTGTGSGLTKIGTGTLLLNSVNVSDYTGATTLMNGKLMLGRANQIPDASKLVLSGGTFDTNGFGDTIGKLNLTGTSVIDFSLAAAVALVFADSKSELWSAGILNIMNFDPSTDSLRVGTDATGLTAFDISEIRFNGTTLAFIDANGFIRPIPEPGVAASLLSAVALLGWRRRRARTRL